MNPKNLNVRMEQGTGDMWLTEEKYKRPIRRITNINQAVLMCLCADLFAEDGTQEVTREVRFADGHRARITVQDITKEPENDDTRPASDRIVGSEQQDGGDVPSLQSPAS